MRVTPLSFMAWDDIKVGTSTRNLVTDKLTVELRRRFTGNAGLVRQKFGVSRTLVNLRYKTPFHSSCQMLGRLLSIRDALSSADGCVLTRCPILKFSLSCPLVKWTD